MARITTTRMHALSAAIACALLAGAAHTYAAGEQAVAGAAQELALDIPAQPLRQALLQFSQQTGQNVLLDGNLDASLRSPAVQGRFSADQALARLLAGSGLTFVRTDGSTLSLLPAPKGGEAPLQLEATSITGRQAGGSTEANPSYAAQDVAYGKGQSLRETPQSVSVVSRKRMEDQNLTTLNQVIDQTTGVTWTQGGSNSNTFYARGFAVSNIQYDGGAGLSYASLYSSGANDIDMAQYERIEVLRGADGLYSGAGEAGGVINLVRKKPSAIPGFSIAQSAGSWDNYRTELDATGPLGFDGRLRGRAVATYTNREFFYDTAKTEGHMVYGTLEADLTPDTLLTVGGSRQESDSVPWRQGLPRYSDGRDLGLSRSTALIPAWNTLDSERTELFARLEHNLSEDWRLRVDASHVTRSELNKGAFVYGAVDPTDGSGATWLGTQVDSESRQLSLDGNVLGNFQLFGLTHQLLVGIDRQRERGDWYSSGSFTGWPVLGQNVDVFAFDRHIVEPQFNGTYRSRYVPLKQDQRGVYGRLNLKLAEPLTLVIGGRRADFEYSAVFNEGAANGYKDNGVTIPYGGLIYDLNEQWTAYASIAEIYKSQANLRNTSGSSLDPISGRSHELGIKGELWEGRVNASLAVYQIERKGEGVKISENDDIANCCYDSQGKVVSRGFDAEINGELLPRLQVFAGYTFNTNKDEEADGVRYSTVTPRHLLKLWTTYQLPGQWERLKVGAGVTAQSANYVSGTANSYNSTSGRFDGDEVAYEYSQAGYALWNASLEYRIDEHWSAQLNGNNLFDKAYYQTMGTSSGMNWYGEPRNFMLTLRGSY